MVIEATHIAVGLGECQVSRSPRDILVAFGLGSCVGIAAYDPAARVAGLLHAVLPQRPAEADSRSAKYVDSGVAHLLAEMSAAGAQRQRLVIRMAGGANMLTVPDLQRAFSIGERNVAAARAALASCGLACAAQEVGGQIGRTLRVYVADGRMTARVIGQTERDF